MSPFTPATNDGKLATFATIPIEKMNVGDAIISMDYERMNFTIDNICAVRASKTKALRVLSFSSPQGTIQTIRTTDSHPFWSHEHGWLLAGQIKIGERFMTVDGEPTFVTETRLERLTEMVTIYNLMLYQNKNFFVTGSGEVCASLMVHDATPTAIVPRKTSLVSSSIHSSNWDNYNI